MKRIAEVFAYTFGGKVRVQGGHYKLYSGNEKAVCAVFTEW